MTIQRTYRHPLHYTANASLDLVVIDYDDEERVEFWVYPGTLQDFEAALYGDDETVKHFATLWAAEREYCKMI